MAPTDIGETFQAELRDALLDAFPSRRNLEQMFYYGLNIRLNEISSESNNLLDTVFDVIRYAESNGRLRELVEAAREANGTNPKLAALIATLPPPSALLRARRGAHHNPLRTLGLLGVTAISVVIVVAVVFADDLSAPQLVGVKIGLGLAMAILIVLISRALRLPIRGVGVVATASVSAVVAALTPVSGSITVSGHVFREGSRDPVLNAVVVVPESNQKSAPTGPDGYFVLTGVPALTQTLYVEWGGGDPVKVTITNAEGGEYPVIPRMRVPVKTAPADIPASAWARVPAAECEPPNVAFALKGPVQGRADGPTQIQIDLLRGVRFVRAFTRNPEGVAVDTDLDQDVQRRWEFKALPRPFDSALEVCVHPQSSEALESDVLRTQYRHVLMP